MPVKPAGGTQRRREPVQLPMFAEVVQDRAQRARRDIGGIGFAVSSVWRGGRCYGGCG